MSGVSPKENRGGDRRSKKYGPVKQSVKSYIQNLKCVESHYTRAKSTRLYMSSEYNVRKLWRAYNADVQNNLQVKYSYFHGIFVSDYNISFKSPATDACSECISLKSMLQGADPKQRVDVIAKLRIHKLRAMAFYDMLKKMRKVF